MARHISLIFAQSHCYFADQSQATHNSLIHQGLKNIVNVQQHATAAIAHHVSNKQHQYQPLQIETIASHSNIPILPGQNCQYAPLNSCVLPCITADETNASYKCRHRNPSSAAIVRINSVERCICI